MLQIDGIIFSAAPRSLSAIVKVRSVSLSSLAFWTIVSTLIAAVANASKIFAAIPGFDIIPIPTQDTFEIIPPKIVQIQEVPDFDEKEAYYIDQINKLQQEFNLSDDDPVLTYHEKWWEQNIDELFPEVTEEEKDALVRRWASFKKDFPLRKIIDKETSIKVIEYEYAVRYLEILGIAPKPNNIF